MERLVRLLLAEDDEDDRELFVEALQDVPPAKIVRFAKNGLELMRQLEFYHPHILFMDINMPKKSGLECLRDIRRQARFNDMLVCMYSTSGNKNDIDASYDMGAQLYVQKSANFEAIKSLLQDLLSEEHHLIKEHPERDHFFIPASGW